MFERVLVLKAVFAYSSRTRIRLSPENQYQRLLVHRCAQYYKLTPDNETKTTHKEMTVLVTLESRM